ncbi:polysaccharide deacetylase family protein [Microbacterium sp. P04]|uniref:polysaccharide deacetylase family protein n=1 Tax=Microbacterium sp. P04 TaxID=3366947 RepID=UPI0037472A65
MAVPGERRRARRRVDRRSRRALVVALAVGAALVAAAAVVSVVAVRGSSADASSPAASVPPPPSSATPSPTPLTAAQALLATSADDNSCAVSFAGAGVVVKPMLQTRGALYSALPLPHLDGEVFAGWYATSADAASRATAGRVNGSDLVTCTDRERTLFAGWTTSADNAAEATAVPVLMYHQFTTKPEGESNALRGNYAYIGDFAAQIAYIADTGFYLPTWDELSAFIDGDLYLPKRSVIVTDDDADSTWLELAAPVVAEHHVLTTSFVITKWRTEGAPNPFVLQRSHTNDMHEAGADGRGRMVNWSAAEIAADLETSAAILGAKEVVAYPFGHYDDTAKAGVAAAGFAMARTIDQGSVRIGSDKLALPCVRVDYGMTLDDLVPLIG